ncbi:hypothetical protein [Paraburkholderia diazotrophica]|uniref:Cell wall surface anchor family protein n=1 Tax=Paraburkholderia diazotrophica TaxID=667676 RepID=A0A1H7CM15_9BURK|nr:hypothetical protein [Paraburkholderia diazotrophica]SEJ86795.1 hypothetical protein SAMN05192539_102135 [Paraburkholderia diazotrophica]
MADSADSTISRPARVRSQKRRASAVSPETENKLARAARSAQRLAQLSDAVRDDSTLDLFPDDTARAEQHAMNIDVRQGTLAGFELPDVVLAAAGAADGGGFPAGPAEAKAGLRGTRAASSSSKEQAPADDPHAGQMLIETEAGLPESAAAASSAVEQASNAASAEDDMAAQPATSASVAKVTGDTSSQTASLATASVMRSVAALRQASATVAGSAEQKEGAKALASGGAAQRPVAASAKAATVARDVTASDASAKPGDGSGAIDGNSGIGATDAMGTNATRPATPPTRAPYVATTSRHQAPRATPELDQARATAFADTVDALYGVIADQRRADSDHSRRMKWLLTIVVCALLMTIAIGIAQTLLLLRLAHQSTAQEQRIEQMMLNQQATLATLLGTDSSTTSLPVSAQTPAPASPAAATAPAKPADAHVAHAQHAQRRKSAHAH